MESSYPVVTEINTGKQKISLQLIRSFEGDGDCPVIFPIGDIAVKGHLVYNLKSDTLNQVKRDFKREGDKLTSYLPQQLPGTEMEYRVFLEREKAKIDVNNGKPVVIKFKGKVPLYLILVNAFCIITVLLLSSLTGFYALFNVRSYRWIIYILLISSLFLSLFLFPLVQKYSLNRWSYMPKMWSLHTKLLLTSLIWVITALLSLFVKKLRRLWLILASIITCVLFLIPHPDSSEHVKITFGLLRKNLIDLLQLF
jgi:hypothetical protein